MTSSSDGLTTRNADTSPASERHRHWIAPGDDAFDIRPLDSHAFKTLKPTENVLTAFPDKSPQKAVLVQGDDLDQAEVSGPARIVALKDHGTSGRLRKKRKRAKKRPGPRGSTGLKWKAEVRRINALDHILQSAGLIRVFVTIRAPKDLPLTDGKRFIQDKVRRLTQTFHRRRKRQDLLGILVYELKVDGHLHAHLMVYLARREHVALVANWADVYEPRPTGKRHDVTTHARPACPSDIAYMTKQRLRLSPEYEANISHSKQASQFIPGPRWTITGDLKAMCLETPECGTTPQVEAKARLSSEKTTPPAEAIRAPNDVQLGLPLIWTPRSHGSDAALMKQFCRQSGYTQQQAAQRLGIRNRSHVANILRGHDGLSPTRRKWLQHCLESGMVPA